MKVKLVLLLLITLRTNVKGTRWKENLYYYNFTLRTYVKGTQCKENYIYI